MGEFGRHGRDISTRFFGAFFAHSPVAPFSNKAPPYVPLFGFRGFTFRRARQFSAFFGAVFASFPTEIFFDDLAALSLHAHLARFLIYDL